MLTQGMLSESNGSVTGAGALLSILRDGQARTRAELVQLTGLARSTVSQRLDALLSHQWIVPADDAISSGGRPATAFTFNRGARVVAAADLGATHARVAVTDLASTVLAERRVDLPIDRGPEEVLGWLVVTLKELLVETGGELCGVGVGLPRAGLPLLRPSRQPADNARMGRVPSA